ncbi:MAG TPA: hypothetical protein VJB98_04050 [Candidatus Paceibacterota bacterium]
MIEIQGRKSGWKIVYYYERSGPTITAGTIDVAGVYKGKFNIGMTYLTAGELRWIADELDKINGNKK